MRDPIISTRAELRDTLKLAWPIVLNQVGHMSMGLVDTMVAGRISTTALAGLGLAANGFWTFTSICMGCLLALDIYFSQSVGAGDQKNLSRYLSQSFWSCGIVTLASGVCIFAAYFIYLQVVPASDTRSAFSSYICSITWCLPSLFVFFVLQRYWQARHCVLPFTVIMVGANLLNLVACLAFGLGEWGFPRLGVSGLALATNISRYAMLAAALIFTWRRLRPQGWGLCRFDLTIQKHIFRLGFPAAGHTALEMGAFTVATFTVGVLGAVPLAAHHVCLMMAAFTFMFPLGFSSAAAVRVGMFIGSGHNERARVAGWLCIGVSVAVMSCFAAGYLVFPRWLLGWFTHDPAVIETGVKILVLVAIFQIADGIQVSTTGALRGIGNTRAAMIANLIGHYPIGLVLGLTLCFGLGWGVVGIWTGLAAGLISVAAMLIGSWVRKTRTISEIRRIEP